MGTCFLSLRNNRPVQPQLKLCQRTISPCVRDTGVWAGQKQHRSLNKWLMTKHIRCVRELQASRLKIGRNTRTQTWRRLLSGAMARGGKKVAWASITHLKKNLYIYFLCGQKENGGVVTEKFSGSVGFVALLSRGVRFLSQEVHFRIWTLNTIPCYVLAAKMSVCLENTVELNIFLVENFPSVSFAYISLEII